MHQQQVVHVIYLCRACFMMYAWGRYSKVYIDWKSTALSSLLMPGAMLGATLAMIAGSTCA